MDPARRAFYDFHAGLVEQWDGPAALGFSDGVIAGATLDRNGLRPLRYAITSDGLFIAGSEAGTVEVDQSTVVEKGRLGPGQMIAVDTRRGIVLRNDLLKGEIADAPAIRRLARARTRPTRRWRSRPRVVDRCRAEQRHAHPRPRRPGDGRTCSAPAATPPRICA